MRQDQQIRVIGETETSIDFYIPDSAFEHWPRKKRARRLRPRNYRARSAKWQRYRKAMGHAR